MSEEKKYWRLSTPFRKLSGKQDLQSNSKVQQSRSRVSSVYLSNSTSTNGFVVVPEFDDPARSQMSHNAVSKHVSHLTKSPSVSFSSPNDVDGYFCDLDSMSDSQYSSYLGEGSCNALVPRADWDDDLSQRLGSAYEHIRSMPSATSPKVSLSSDPYMLRKQLGVPQHSVLNHPIHFSPDLPNPHALLRRSTSPERLAAAPPDVSHTRTSKKFNSCANTHPYPISHIRSSSDLVQPVQMHSVQNVSALTENSPSQYRTLETPRSSHTVACTPQPQSKLVKRRIEKPIPTSLPPSRRQALKGVLRKPVSDTAPSTNEHTYQISLPQIRPPSPLKLDIPLHHTWRDRRTDFRSLTACRSTRVDFHETKSRQTIGSTDILASLAWIGTPPMISGSEIANRRTHLPSRAFSPDGFSMAVAVEDDSISDDALVNRLERVRRTGGPPMRYRDVSSLRTPDANAHELPHTSSSSFSPQSADQSVTPSDVFLPPQSIAQPATPDSEDGEVWEAARRALLCIREIVRTEKKYREALKMLLNAETATPPPPSMVPYISALLRASETLLQYFLEDPSAWGVSTAFVTSEDELEATMVSWCAVVGVFFMDENDPRSSGLMSRWRHRKTGAISSPSAPTTKQTSISLSPRLPSMTQTTKTASKIHGWAGEEFGAWQTEEERQTFVLFQKPEDIDKRTSTSQPPSRKLSVRDLAIQPIQRVMRYVLLYRDLLDCTPVTSPSRPLVERALEAATRIANHCDRAQRNPAFFHAS